MATAYGGATGPANTSGQGSSSPVPPEISGNWNWGGFLLNWIWGIGNKVWIALLALVAGVLGVFIPFVGILALGVSIYLGIKGNDLAWQARPWNSIEHFKEVQRKWTIAGVIVIVLLLILGLVFGVLSAATIRQSGGY
jgi:uncharacterized BrkB/YihY/UPF0761 family membrane protein